MRLVPAGHRVGGRLLLRAWHRVGGRLLLRAMADEAAFTAWLGVVVGSGAARRSLPARLRTILIAGYKAGLIDEDDVYLPSCEMDASSLASSITIWDALYVDSLAVAKETASASEKVKLHEWLRARFYKDATPKDDVVLSAAALDDMKEQGATEAWQLGFIELALATGRTPARKEVEGFSYRAPWSSMVGGKSAIKFKQETLDDVLEKAQYRGDLQLVDDFFQELSASLTEDKSDLFACEVSARAHQWLQQARIVLRRPQMILSYLVAYRKRYKGRGIPKVREESLLMEAMSGFISSGSAMHDRTPPSPAMSSMSDGASSVGPSASMTGGGSVSSRDDAALQERMSELLSVVSKSSTDITTLAGAVRGVQSNLDQLSSKVRSMEDSNRPQTWRSPRL